MIPAPWNLTGRGLILFYQLPYLWLLEHGHIPKHLLGRFAGGWSAVMLVDYGSSNCGAYQELLFIPGMFRCRAGTYFGISKIYVSSQSSVENGIANWGIPKEHAEFEWIKTDLERVRVGGFAEFTFSSQATGLPLQLGLIPQPWRTIMQPELEGISLIPQKTGEVLLTTLAGNGTIHPAKLHSARADGAYFPNLEGIRPKLVVMAEPFNLIFPIPRQTALE